LYVQQLTREECRHQLTRETLIPRISVSSRLRDIEIDPGNFSKKRSKEMAARISAALLVAIFVLAPYAVAQSNWCVMDAMSAAIADQSS
jgi:hypothetical protein